jgi:hypothetical protein
MQHERSERFLLRLAETLTSAAHAQETPTHEPGTCLTRLKKLVLVNTHVQIHNVLTPGVALVSSLATRSPNPASSSRLLPSPPARGPNVSSLSTYRHLADVLPLLDTDNQTNLTQTTCRSAPSLRLSLWRKRAAWQPPRTHHLSNSVYFQVHTRRTLLCVCVCVRARVHAGCSTYRRHHPNAS